ncbi:hypothetical protein EB796_011738 [Bugula neritina]|uniref:Uncharacterized protein n=1 Tax=Bugula neritina TaxID=10212 RepID=A0A7J7JU92_BUGNE|nr:hypothetical protein EB796_011738 [Bugula neritina]
MKSSNSMKPALLANLITMQVNTPLLSRLACLSQFIGVEGTRFVSVILLEDALPLSDQIPQFTELIKAQFPRVVILNTGSRKTPTNDATTRANINRITYQLSKEQGNNIVAESRCFIILASYTH